MQQVISLAQVDTANARGRRNLAMLDLMYDNGARVQELIDLRPSSIRLEAPYIVKLTGKGRKERVVPLQDEQTVLLKAYMDENKMLEPHYNQHPLFFNCWRKKLTRNKFNLLLLYHTETLMYLALYFRLRFLAVTLSQIECLLLFTAKTIKVKNTVHLHLIINNLLTRKL